MLNPYLKYFIARSKSNRGFTLVELMVVMVIVGILAVGVVFMFADPTAKVKAAAFEMRGELNRGRAEAVSKNMDVHIVFLPGASDADQDGYRIWIDDWDVGGGGGPGSDGVYTAGSDTLIQETYFPVEVQYYDANATDGPGVKPVAADGSLDMTDGDSDDDGIEFDGVNRFIYTSMGTPQNSASNPLANTGYIYIYLPASTGHTIMRAGPYALVVVPGAGSIRIARWNKKDSIWQTK